MKLSCRGVCVWVSLGIWLAVAGIPARAQSFVMSTPRASQRAVVSQRIGLTDIKIHYHRPLVGGRKIWDGIVPYGQVWRAGANENTTIEFTDAISVEGQPLARGIYGLHMIPAAESWTIIFSKNSTSWGSFTYDQKEDALRVTVKPHGDEFHEALTYDFDDPKQDSAVVTLRWEKIAVPIHVSVSKENALQNIRLQLRDLAQYVWMGWDDAATYCADNSINLEEGLRWAERSIQLEERFENLMTKSRLLKASGKTGEATAAQNQAVEKGTIFQIYGFARQLQLQNQQAEGLEFLRAAAKRFPSHWLGHVAQARVYSAAGDFANAAKELKAADAAGAPAQQKPNLERLLKRLEAKEDINK